MTKTDQQGDRFKEAARELGVDEHDDEAFRRAIRKIGEHHPVKDEKRPGKKSVR